MLVPITYKKHPRAEFTDILSRSSIMRDEQIALTRQLKAIIENPGTTDQTPGDRNHARIILLDRIRDAVIPTLAQSQGLSKMALNLMIHGQDFREMRDPDAQDAELNPDKIKTYAQHTIVHSFRTAVRGIHFSQMILAHPQYAPLRLAGSSKAEFERMAQEHTESLQRAAALPQLNSDPATPAEALRDALLKAFEGDLCLDYDELEEFIYAMNKLDIKAGEALMEVRRALVASIGQHLPYSKAYLEQNPAVKNLLGLVMV